MRVTCIQMDMTFAAPQENFSRAEALLRQAVISEQPDTVLLPETWNTGFFPKENLAQYADDNGAQTKSVFSALAKEFNVNIVAGSVANRRADGIY